MLTKQNQLIAVLGVGALLLIFVIYPTLVHANTSTLQMTITLTDTNGVPHAYTQSGITPLTITVGGVAVSTITYSVAVVPTYTGTLSTESIAYSYPTHTVTSAGVTLPATPSGTLILASPFAASGASIPIPGANYVITAATLSAGTVGTYILSCTASATINTTFTDGTISSRTATSIAATVTYAYASTSGVTAFTVNITPASA